MSAPKLPAVRLQPGGECLVQDAVVLDLPASSKFSFSWPPDNKPIPTPPSSDRPNLSSGSEGEIESSEDESGNEHGNMDQFKEESTSTQTSRFRAQHAGGLSPPLPRFSRALSMPLPSRLGQLQNPHRNGNASPNTPSSSGSGTPDSPHFRELSLELADSVQMIVQTMLQVSPAQVLDPAKEQFSACSLSIPTPSMSAMFTTMKNLNYISANMASFCMEPPLHGTGSDPGNTQSVADNIPSIHNDFDIGELLQSVGDALSGAAAQVGVDLVLYHGDVGMKHVSVRGDESGISYTLSHIIRQVLSTAQRGDSIEIGLFTSFVHHKQQDISSSAEVDAPHMDGHQLSSSPVELDGPLQCTVVVSHKYGSFDSGFDNGIATTPGAIQSRPQPSFSTLLLRRLLSQLRATLTTDLPPPDTFAVGRTCKLVMTLERGSTSAIHTPSASMAGIQDNRVQEEPSLDQLHLFSETLRGKRVTLYASSKGSFAQHLTSYLTAWGMDVSHVSSEGGIEAESPANPTPSLEPRINSHIPMYLPNADGLTPTGLSSRQPATHQLSFIFIDDDVDVLRERLYALRIEQPYALNLNSRKRPSLAAHHRPRSSPQIARAMGSTLLPPPSTSPAPSVVIVHFTSLSNYKVVKDVIQTALTSFAGSSAPTPEVMVIPKPAGPRRFLTALHTAVTKPVVDPIFTPIATSPISPGLQTRESFFYNEYKASSNPKSPVSKTHRPAGSRSNSDRSTRSNRESSEHPHIPPPSPLGLSDNVEYFSEAAVKLGSSPSSGLVIQSPDGQPAGIFFHPRGKGQRNPSSHTMERDKGQLHIPLERRRTAARVPSGDLQDAVSFAALHESAAPPNRPPLGIETKSGPSTSTSRVMARKQSISPRGSPRTEDGPSLQTTVLGGRRGSQPDPRKTLTPPGSPPVDGTPPARRAVPRRSTQDIKDKKGKSLADNIVPRISVLIVDDNPINQTILSTFMKKKTIKYEVASNGQEAVQKWRTGEFHLILMDIQMPIMDGIQATKEIRRLEKVNATAGYPPSTPMSDDLPRTPPVRTPSDTSAEVDSSRGTASPYRSSVIIVALTASSLQSDRVAALAAGCNDFLTKPVSLQWLNNKIIEWGSIKALQMWADLRPDVVKNLSAGQAVQARNVAERLHVPTKPRRTPPPSRSSSSVPNGQSSLVLPGVAPSPNGDASGCGSGLTVVPMASTSSAFWTGQTSPAAFWGPTSSPTVSNDLGQTDSAEEAPVVNSDPLEPEALIESAVATDLAIDAGGTPKINGRTASTPSPELLKDSLPLTNSSLSPSDITVPHEDVTQSFDQESTPPSSPPASAYETVPSSPSQ